MSSLTEDEVELRDLVAGVLDNAGVLGNLKAQLRAHVYTALEKGEVGDKSSLVNPALRDFLSNTTGRLLMSLVREFLEFFSLDFTLSVFDPETNIDKDFRYRGRSKLIDALGLTELVDPKFPLLSEVMRLSKVSVLKSESPTPTEVSDENTSNQTSLVDDPSKSEKDKHEFREFKKFGGAETSDEVSSPSSGSTPQLSLHLDPSIQPHKLSPQTSKENEEKNMESRIALDQKNSLQKSISGHSDGFLDTERLTGLEAKKIVEPIERKSTLLRDLPPLGNMSSLGDLPPLSGSRPSGSLAPLKKIQHLPSNQQSKLPSTTDSLERGKESAAAAVNTQVPNLGFKKDHVLADTKGSCLAKDLNMEEKKNSEKYSDDFSVSEDIEEDLDSFLNSSQSTQENFTKEETVANSDVSLRADHVESL